MNGFPLGFPLARFFLLNTPNKRISSLSFIFSATERVGSDRKSNSMRNMHISGQMDECFVIESRDAGPCRESNKSLASQAGYCMNWRREVGEMSVRDEL